MKHLSLILLFSLLHLHLFAQKTPEEHVNANAIKIDPLRLLGADFPLVYERKIIPRIAAEVEAGPTFSGWRFSKRYGKIHPYDASRIIGKYGFLATVALRYYPLANGTGLRKFYLSPKVSYCTFNTDAIDSYSETTYYEEYRNEYIQAALNIGWQAWYAKHFAVDYYIGGGMSWNSYAFRLSSADDGGFINPWYNQKEAVFTLNVGIKLSVGW